MIHVLTFPVPAEPMGANKMPRSRGGAIGMSKKRQAWRDTTTAYALDWLDPERGLGTEPGAPLPPCEVRVHIPFETERARDPHNYTSTVVKWVIDGLVNAGVWPDDGPAWVRVLDPVCYVSNEVRVEMIPMEDPT